MKENHSIKKHSASHVFSNAQSCGSIVQFNTHIPRPMKKLNRPPIKIKQSAQKPKPLSEIGGNDQEAFERFIPKKSHTLSVMEKNVNQRVQLIRKARNQALLPT